MEPHPHLQRSQAKTRKQIAMDFNIEPWESPEKENDN
jgi:hypothetical protein